MITWDGTDNQGVTGVTAENMREYVDHHVTSDIRMTTLMGMSLGEIMLDHERITAREMSRNVELLAKHEVDKWCAAT